MIEILWMLVKAFLVGGLLCAIGQVLIMKTQLTSARILVGYVTAALFSARWGCINRLLILRARARPFRCWALGMRWRAVQSRA